MVAIQEIAAFDLDGTLVDGQTQEMLVRHMGKQRILPVSTVLAVLLWVVRYRLGLRVDHESIRLRVLSSLAGRSVESLEQIVGVVVAQYVVPRMRSCGKKAIQDLENEGVRTVIVSAAAEPLVAQVANELGASGAIGTKLESVSGVYTGRINGPVLLGKHKVSAVRSWAGLRFGQWGLARAYGDHDSDIPLLEEATTAYAVCPNAKLRVTAFERKWSVLDWSDC